jgi:hypothetical protein
VWRLSASKAINLGSRELVNTFERCARSSPASRLMRSRSLSILGMGVASRSTMVTQAMF